MASIDEPNVQSLVDVLTDNASDLVDTILDIYVRLSKANIKDPQGAQQRSRRVIGELSGIIEQFIDSSKTSTDDVLAGAYIKGIKDADAAIKAVGKEIGPGGPITTGSSFTSANVAPAPLTQKQLDLFKDFQRHQTMFGVFKQATFDDIEQMKVPILRATRDNLREIAIEAGNAEFLEGNTRTRRDIYKNMLTRFADRGITGVVYSDGRRVDVRSYADMLARTKMGNANRQARINRQLEQGHDLVRVSIHSRCSNLCLPYQGRVFSASGRSRQYPPLQEAIDGGLFHPNCKHATNPYFPGLSEKLDPDGSPTEQRLGDRKTYKAEQRQRQIERYIRKYKDRSSVALSKADKVQAKAFIKKWQKAQRNHLKANSYLKRRYDREQI